MIVSDLEDRESQNAISDLYSQGTTLALGLDFAEVRGYEYRRAGVARDARTRVTAGASAYMNCWC